MDQAKMAQKPVNCKLANGGVLAAMMVVAIHTAGRELSDIDAGTTLWWLEALGHYGVFLVAVPFFFVCSGYFLAGHITERGWWRQECMKRVRTLVVPYVIWSLITAFFPVIIALIANLLHDEEPFAKIAVSRQFWINAFGLSPFRYPGMAQLWYVRSLFVFVTLSPFISYCLSKHARGVLVLLFIASLVLGIRLVSPNPHKIDLFFSKFMNLQGLFYFSFGIWIRLKRLEIGVIATMLKSKRWGFPLAVWSIAVGLIIVMLATIFCYYTGHNLVQAARILFVPPLLLAFVHFIPEQPFSALFNNSAFPVFVMHTLVWKTLGIVLPLRVNAIGAWLLKWAIGFFISAAAADLLHRFAPRTAKLVFGGR